jgi:hypothetical protein
MFDAQKHNAKNTRSDPERSPPKTPDPWKKHRIASRGRFNKRLIAKNSSDSTNPS